MALNAGNKVYKSQGELELCAETVTQAKDNNCEDIAKHSAMDPMIQKHPGGVDTGPIFSRQVQFPEDKPNKSMYRSKRTFP